MFGIKVRKMVITHFNHSHHNKKASRTFVLGKPPIMSDVTDRLNFS